MRELTPKQKKFARNYVATGNASKSYRESYDAKNMNNKSVAEEARDLLKHSGILAYIEQVHNELSMEFNVTMGSLLMELEETRQSALAAENFNTALNATMGKAKITGFDKKSIELSGKPEGAPSINISLSK